MMRLPIFPALLVAFSLVAQDAPKASDASQLRLQDAIQIALKNNLQVQISQQTRESTKALELQSLGTYDWTLNSAYAITHSKFQPDGHSFDNSGNPIFGNTITDTRKWNVGVAKATEWGGLLKVDYTNPNYSSTEYNYLGSQTYSTRYPYTGSFSASFTQSLLRGFGREATATNLIVSRYGAQAADYTFQLAIINNVATTESAYWDVVYAKRNLENKRQALALAKQQLKENQIRVQVGTLAPIEVTSSEASVAQAEQDIITSEAGLLNAKDALIRTLYPTTDRPANLDTVDLPSVKPLELDEESAVKQALASRLELKSAQLDLKAKQVQESAANNHLLPQLDLSVGYNLNSNVQNSWSAVNTDLTNRKDPGYSVGLQFSLPILNRGAKGSLAIARASRRSSELNLHDQELGIVLQVRTAFRTLESSAKGVAAAEKTRYFREKDLEAEQKKFENGMSTNFLVLSKLNDLNTAKGNELQAQIAYAKAVTSMDQSVGRLLEARKLEVK